MVREFGPEVAVPLKKAIARTKGVILVASLPTEKMTSIEISPGDPDSKIGETWVPGEVLFVGLNPPSNYGYGVKETNLAMAEVARGVTKNRVTAYRHRLDPAQFLYNKDQVRFGSIYFEEVFPKAVSMVTTQVITAKNPYYRDLLAGIKVKAGKEYIDRRPLNLTIGTTVVFYPSIFVAMFASELKPEDDQEQFGLKSETTSGAIITMKRETLNILAVAEHAQDDQRVVMMRAATSMYSRRPQLTQAS